MAFMSEEVMWVPGWCVEGEFGGGEGEKSQGFDLRLQGSLAVGPPGLLPAFAVHWEARCAARC